jgi:hypothetical protein
MKARGRLDRKKAHGLGIFAERAAVLILRLKGYRILACRYRVQGGEIDIVTRRARRDRFRRSEGTANSRRGQDRDRLHQTSPHLPRGENLARFEPLGGAVDVARRRNLHRALALAASRNRGIRTGSGISPRAPCLARTPAFISPAPMSRPNGQACFRVRKFTLKQEDTALIRFPFAAKSRYLHEILLDWSGFNGTR